MTAEAPADSENLVTIDVELSAAEWQMRTKMTVPAGPDLGLNEAVGFLDPVLGVMPSIDWVPPRRQLIDH